MKWSWKIARVAGIDIYIHATFVLLVGFIFVSYYLTERSLAAALNGVLFILALFACVLLHELGHALAARRFGVPTRDINLLPIGGVARLERMPEKPKEELSVALAGPATNLVIAAALFVVLQVTEGLGALGGVSLTGGSFLGRLMGVNLSLALFNLIPAFPMDGGRVIRALLATRLEYTRATQIAAGLGQAIAFVFGFIGLFSNPFLIFIALFVWIGAAQEASMVQMKSALSGIPVERAMLTRFESLSPSDPLSRAVDFLLAGSQHDFPVLEGGQVVGVLTRQNLVSALSSEGQAGPVGSVMTRQFRVMDYAQMLEGAAGCLRAQECSIVPVMRNGELVGLLTLDNLGEFLAVQAALTARSPHPIR